MSFHDMALALPPEGQESDFESPAQAATIAWVLFIVSITLAFLTVVLRLYVKRFVSKTKISWDDGLCVAAISLSIIHIAVGLYSLDYGLGKYLYNIRLSSITEKNLLAMTSANLIVTINMFMVRWAVLGLYYRLFKVHETSRKLIYIGFVASAVIAIPEAGVAIGRMMKCTNALASITTDYCNKKNTGIAVMSFALAACIVDVFIYSIAIARLRQLQVERSRKVYITLVFAMGFMAVGCGFFIFIFNAVKFNSPEQMWVALWVAIFKTLEANIALTCTSATFFPAFWKSIFPKPVNTSIKLSDGSTRYGSKRTPLGGSNEALVESNKFGMNLPRLMPAKLSQADKSYFNSTATTASQDYPPSFYKGRSTDV